MLMLLVMGWGPGMLLVLALLWTSRTKAPLIFPQGKLSLAATAVIGAVGSAGVWATWLSWAVGPHGDYAVWQVVACGVTYAVLLVLLMWFTRKIGWGELVAAWSSVCGFSLGWACWAAPSDETGLWGVGFLMIVVGLSAAGAALGLVVGILRRQKVRAVK